MTFAKIKPVLLGAALLASAPMMASADGRAFDCDPDRQNGGRWIVAFDTGSASIRAVDEEQIDEAAQRAKDRFIQRICLLAYADPRGDEASNEALSLRRANAVQAELRARGVSAEMESHALGEAPGGFLGFLADDSQADRRVEIVLVR